MRTIDDDAGVRLYYLDQDSAVATTLFYGSLADALRMATREPLDVQIGLFLQTSNDIVSYLDLHAG